MDRILVVADKVEESPIALKRANQLSKQLGASIHVVYFCFEDINHSSLNSEDVKSKLLTVTQQRADNEIASNVDNNIDYSCEVVWEKDITAWVLKYLDKYPETMILKTGNRSEKLFYTPTDWQLLRDVPAPIFLTCEEKWRKSHNVMACLDLQTKVKDKQELNQYIVKQAKQLADAQNSELHICYTIPFSNLLRDLGLQYKDEIEDNAIAAVTSIVDQLKADYALDDSHIHIHAGPAEKVILSTSAEAKAGIVVIGTVGRRGVSARLVGNTAEKVLPLLKSDVLTLKLT